MNGKSSDLVGGPETRQPETRQPANLSDFEATDGRSERRSFRGIDLSGAQAPEDAEFVDCDFSLATLKGVDISGLTFRNCLFQQTDLAGATLTGAKFLESCDFSRAILVRAEATETQFERADLSHADATAAIFHQASFGGSTTTQAIFDRADLTDVTGFSPDASRLVGTTISSNRADAWTKLRADYTGLNLVLSLLPALVFVSSLLIDAYVSVAGTALITAGNTEAVCGYDGADCAEYMLWEIILGFAEGYLAVIFVLFSILYNACRFALTLQVSRLARHEDRTGRTPYIGGRGGYGLLSMAHSVVWWAKWAMLILFLWNMGVLLFKPVLLPT